MRGLHRLILVFSICCVLTRKSNAFTIFKAQSPSRGNGMMRMFDALQEMMTGEKLFNRKLFQEYQLCMRSFDSKLPESHDNAYNGLIDFWNSRGFKDDPWGGTSTDLVEKNVTAMTLHGMEIYEPCNTISNLAFYSVAHEVCVSRRNGEKYNLPWIYRFSWIEY